jgi:hypothetical protein
LLLRDLDTVPSSEIMFDGPQLCPTYGPRPVLLQLTTDHVIPRLSRTVSPFLSRGRSDQAQSDVFWSALGTLIDWLINSAFIVRHPSGLCRPR